MIKIIFGNEPFLISQIKKETFSIILNSDFNLSMHEIFDENVFNLCNTYPIMESKRVIFIDLDKLSMLDNECFNTYRKAPTEFTEVLILCRNVDKNTKFAKMLKKEGILLEVNKLKEEAELRTILQKFIKDKNGSIEPAALRELISRENYFDNESINLISISHDIDSLLNISRNITLNMVKENIKDMAVENVFVLAKLIEKGDSIALKKEISLISPDKTIPTLSLLLREYRIAYKATFIPLSDIGIKYCTLNKMSKKQLIHGMRICTSLIEDIKTGRVSEHIALQLAVVQLLQKKEKNA